MTAGEIILGGGGCDILGVYRKKSEGGGALGGGGGGLGVGGGGDDKKEGDSEELIDKGTFSVRHVPGPLKTSGGREQKKEFVQSLKVIENQKKKKET